MRCYHPHDPVLPGLSQFNAQDNSVNYLAYYGKPCNCSSRVIFCCRWKIPTPFASHAFHPIDGFLQSCPYHIYPFLFPLHKFTYLVLFVFVNLWTVSIHDGDYRVPEFLKSYINGSAHHTDHHLFYNYNYGQFFTLWDRIGQSFRTPSAWEGDSPLAQVLKGTHPNGVSRKSK